MQLHKQANRDACDQNDRDENGQLSLQHHVEGGAKGDHHRRDGEEKSGQAYYQLRRQGFKERVLVVARGEDS